MKVKAKKPQSAIAPFASVLEQDYAEELMRRKNVGDIRAWHYSPFRLILAHNTSYAPDFLIVTLDEYIELHEVKGFWRDDARVKVKVAARLFPYFTFQAVTRPRKNGGWVYEEIKA